MHRVCMCVCIYNVGFLPKLGTLKQIISKDKNLLLFALCFAFFPRL